jgi:transcriptional regulator with XRE-family HTH domain
MATWSSSKSEARGLMAEQPEKLGDRILRLRRALDWDQAELAERAGVKPTQISKYERGTYEPKLSALSRIAAVLGTSTDYLITGKEAAALEPDHLIALWPTLQQLPLALRNEIAGFLRTVLHAQSLLGLSEVAWQRPRRSSPTGKPARRRQRNRAQSEKVRAMT